MKKNLRRLVAFGLTAAMGATMLTGCGGGNTAGGVDPHLLTAAAKTAK